MQQRVGELERGKARVLCEEKKKRKKMREKRISGMDVWFVMVLYGY